MKGIVLEEIGESPRCTEVSPRQPDSWVPVDVKASAINHRDVWITKGQYAHIQLPCILGSDGAGLYNGKRVMIQPGIGWGDSELHQSSDYKILGMPDDGTMAELSYVPEKNLYEIPDHLSYLEAAAFGLAGLTAYRAVVVKGVCTSGDKVLITGIGGGVALCAMQIALACGAEVYVTSSNPNKINRAQELGVSAGYNYKSDDYARAMRSDHREGFDLIIDSAGGSGFSDLVKSAAFGGRIVLYGGSAGKWADLSPQMVFWKQISIMGSTMGSSKDFENWLEFITDYKLYPFVSQEFKLEDVNKAFNLVDRGEQMGKVMFNHSL